MASCAAGMLRLLATLALALSYGGVRSLSITKDFEENSKLTLDSYRKTKPRQDLTWEQQRAEKSAGWNAQKEARTRKALYVDGEDDPTKVIFPGHNPKFLKLTECLGGDWRNTTVTRISEWAANIETSAMAKRLQFVHTYFVFDVAFGNDHEKVQRISYQLEQGPLDTSRDMPGGPAYVLCSPFTLEHVTRGEPWGGDGPAPITEKQQIMLGADQKNSAADAAAKPGLSMLDVFKEAQRFLDNHPTYGLALMDALQGEARDCQDYAIHMYNHLKNDIDPESNLKQPWQKRFMASTAHRFGSDPTDLLKGLSENNQIRLRTEDRLNSAFRTGKKDGTDFFKAIMISSKLHKYKKHLREKAAKRRAKQGKKIGDYTKEKKAADEERKTRESYDDGMGFDFGGFEEEVDQDSAEGGGQEGEVQFEEDGDDGEDGH